jgi:hypothetical protein
MDDERVRELARRVVERVTLSPAGEGDIALVQDAIRQAVAEERSRCAALCDAIEDQFYKRLGTQYEEGLSDGASNCADAIRAGQGKK